MRQQVIETKLGVDHPKVLGFFLENRIAYSYHQQLAGQTSFSDLKQEATILLQNFVGRLP